MKSTFFKVLTFLFVCTCSGNNNPVNVCLDIDTEAQTLDIDMSNGLHFKGPYTQGQNDSLIFKGFDGRTSMKLREGRMDMVWAFELFGWGLHRVECKCHPVPSRASIENRP